MTPLERAEQPKTEEGAGSSYAVADWWCRQCSYFPRCVEADRCLAGGGREPGGRGRSTESGAPALAHNAGPAPTASSELGPALESTREVAPPSDATGVEARVASDGAVVSEAAPRPSSAHIMSRHVSVGRPEFDLQGPAPTASEQPSLDRVMEEKFGRAVYHGYLMPWPPESPSQPLESSTVEEEAREELANRLYHAAARANWETEYDDRQVYVSHKAAREAFELLRDARFQLLKVMRTLGEALIAKGTWQTLYNAWRKRWNTQPKRSTRHLPPALLPQLSSRSRTG